MQIDISKHIEKLLFEHDTLIIPGFGGFTATRSPAAVDYAGGSAFPPSKTLVFNENLKIDDGILSYDVSRAHGLSAEEAKQAIQDFVDQTIIQLNAREIVALPGVGRLYKNYEQKIQFLPDANNLNRDAFGLPPIQFSPIARSREVAEPTAAPETAPPPSIETPAPPPPPPVTTFEAPVVPPVEKIAAPSAPITPPYTAQVDAPPPASGGIISWIIGALLLALLAGLGYNIYKKRQTAAAETEIVAGNGIEDEGSPREKTLAEEVKGATDNVEVKMPDPDQMPPATSESEKTTPPPPAEKPAAKPKVTESTPPKKTTAASGGRHCILIIGSFKDERNIDRLIAKLKANNLDIYQKKAGGGATQLGIEFNYTDLTQIDEQVSNLQRISGERNIVIKRQ
jgi:CCDC81-like prokaryotic HU domain 1/CCDC81-like prokaryotic HU domain 2